MTIDTQKLRARAIESGDGYLRGLALAAADHIDAQAAEIEKLRIQIDGYDGAIAKRDLEIERLRDALKKCAAVCAGYTSDKRGLIEALEAARAALSGEGK